MTAPPGAEIQAMFGEIAPQYDLLNRVLSFGIDRRWRRRLVRELGLGPRHRILDLCCGTGDLALALADTGAAVVGADFTGPMLPLARDKAARSERPLHLARADAQALPFAAGSYDAVTIAFGIRNVEDPLQGLMECARVLRPGGRLAVLEFFPIRNRVWRWMFEGYFHHVLPRIARLTRAGRTGAYEYLPASVAGFASPDQFCDWIGQAGLCDASHHPLTGGVARLVLATRAPEPA
ncbi:MAG: bifunctional demethylmenaquinone methyltransferase/2-methoxy-6-polyprenyl-1,4-benzoquinol methylase UbiE [Planctomycetes bacterium]|nr:bifunctional demethylmenaquinone methyltransferase/2-methoxy-6-polyprenyl-1,4-benzoquinol methylase UbiE [Planctomycetota bacterium]MBL7008541.1 bifunctional demethylmenaquinone methyltransferase/2-methoxy-6-polyprenyl-1,4-benzoquinol methylase UbiE [Planctomycetota bacterium]